jgi:di/tricarboxylate transporter
MTMSRNTVLAVIFFIAVIVLGAVRWLQSGGFSWGGQWGYAGLSQSEASNPIFAVAFIMVAAVVFGGFVYVSSKRSKKVTATV